MTLATADADGRPWATPVWFANSGVEELLWVSEPGARHSRNIASRPEVAVALFDSTVPPSRDAQAAYLEGIASEVGADELPRCIAIFSRRSQTRGGRTWTVGDVSGAASLRLYRAAVTKRYTLEDGDRRVPA